ncbi:ciliogenesis and planar polarity effector 2-like isoform X2 [Rhodnius prolixus]|uniref:ciliogenesis and planar polarity effector 2-like isoform X2 n=1 Tax=Rhodnius prolixus TaxID=13249 RepID=UPI003D18D134
MYKGSIQSDWQSTAEGILEQPAVHAVIEEVRYKVVLLGKSGVGKTWTVARLAGVAGNNGTSYQTFETVGIRVTNIYWPVKIRDKIVLFKLTVWDPGSHSFKKYTHIPVTCQEKADMQIIFFSYNDASSFNDLLPLINKCGKKDEDNSPGLLIIGTRHLSKTEVSKSEVQEFQMKHNVQIMSLPAATSGSNELSKVSPILNTICEQLWYRDQQYIMNQNVNL